MRSKAAKHEEVSPKKKGVLGSIIIALSLVSIILLLSFLFIAKQSLTESTNITMGEQIKERATSLAYSIDTAIGQQIDDIKIIAGSPAVINFVVKVNHRYSQKSATSNEVEEANQKWIQAQGTAAIDSDLATNEIAGYLRDYIKIKGEENQVVTLFITDLKGALVSTINEAPKYFHGDDLWWRKVYDDGGTKAYISDIYYDGAAKEYLIDIALPIRDGGHTIGLIKKTQAVNKFFSRSIPKAKTDHTMLVDSKGKVIFCPVLDTGSSIIDRKLVLSLVSPGPAWAEVADDGHGGKISIIGSAPLDATNILLGEARADAKWYAFTWQDQAKTYAVAGRPLSWIMIYGLIASIIIIIAGYLAMRRIMFPIKRLLEGAEIIGEGDLDYHIDINTNDEIGELADRFNQLTITFKSFVNERKGLEKKLIEYAEELKRKESEWAKYQMINTEKIISIERFAEGIAHEINNHLGIIFGFIQVMLKDCDHGCHSYEEIKIIEKHINYTKKIIDDLLDFARISRLEKEELDINKNIEGAVLLIEKKLSLENISVNLDLASNLPRVVCDPKKLQHVYMSLMANSAHTMKGGGIFAISTSYDKDNKSIEIKFKDTGAGIPYDELGKVFSPFYKSRGKQEGIGLSLSASYGIIKEHRGEILVESKEGEGTIFKILLPVNQEEMVVPPKYDLRRVGN